MMYAPMNSRQRPVNNPRGEAGVVTMSERPVYQPQPDPPPQENQQMSRQTAPQQPQPMARNPGNQMGMNQQQGNQMRMNPGMQQNRPMGNPNMRPGMGTGMQQGQGGGLLSKLLSIKDPVGSINKIAAIMKLFG